MRVWLQGTYYIFRLEDLHKYVLNKRELNWIELNNIKLIL